MIAMPALPNHLPWHLKAYLVLDGVRLPDVAQRIQQWPNPREYLYATTRWHALVDISPYLIRLSGPYDPVLRYFKANAVLEPGYLLFTQSGIGYQLEAERALIHRTFFRVNDLKIITGRGHRAPLSGRFKLKAVDALPEQLGADKPWLIQRDELEKVDA